MFDLSQEADSRSRKARNEADEATMEIPAIEIVVAMTRTGVIGRQQALPWRLRSDLRRFRRITTGHVLLAGRRTQESIGRPLPKRHTLVLSRRTPTGEGQEPGLSWIRSLAEVSSAARLAAHRADELRPVPVFCVGGAEVYRLVLPFARALHVTWVEADVAGDTRFPDLDWEEWRPPDEFEEFASDEHNEFPTRFGVYRRRAIA